MAEPDPDDRTEWDLAWASAPRRLLLELSKFDWAGLTGFDLGEIVAVTFTEVPHQYIGHLYISVEVCPICGRNVGDPESRAEVSLAPIFERRPDVGFGAWMHRECVNSCPLIDEPGHIPW